MKEIIFWVLYILTTAIIIYRLNKAFAYFNAKFKKKNIESLLPDVSVIQIINGNGIDIGFNLQSNIKKMPNSHFIFVVEKNREDIKNEITRVEKQEENYSLLEVEAGLSVGKKLQEALKLAKEYIIFLDENIELEGSISEIIEELAMNEFIVNGLIYDAKEGEALVGLNSSFYNSHRIFADLSLAEKGMLQRVNSKFFGVKKKNLMEQNVFVQLGEEFIDEIELAKAALEKGVRVFQSRVIGRNNYEASDFTKFSLSIGEEIEGFRNIRKESLNPLIYILTILPVFLPCVTLFYSATLGINYFVLVMTSILLKAIDTYIMRKLMTEKTLWYGEILREFFIDAFGVIFIFFRKSR